MKKIICLFLLLCNLSFADEIQLDLEFAKTEKERMAGLMGRASLEKDQGMLFIYPKKQETSIWMFNCYFDLSIAFLDEKGVIKEIHELKAYPEKIDPFRSIDDYSINDPVVLFFLSQSVKSSFQVSFALEMNAGWFYNHGVSLGDLVVWDEKTGKAHIVRKEVTTKKENHV